MSTLDFQKGKQAEHLFETLLKQNNITYTDVTADSEYQQRDIDYIVNAKKQLLVDVKYVGKNYNHDLIELQVNNALKSGWGYTSNADYFALYEAKVQMFHILNGKKIREILPNIVDKYRVVKANTYYDNGPLKYTSLNLQVHYEELVKLGILSHIYANQNNKWVRLDADKYILER